jgi:diguanylate cyclase (GGDEF)-like protein/PAS domain S-box-containing protein
MFSLDPEIVSHALADARIATWEWTAATDELRWTSGQTEIYSRPSRELNTGAAWNSIVHPDDLERVHSATRRALETEAGFREQFRVFGKDGKILWIFGYGKFHRLPDQTVRISGMNIDVTDWANALAAAEDRFTATFEQAAVGIAHVGIDGTWLNMNRRCCEIVGYTKEELSKLTFGDITHPDDLDADWEQVRALLAQERSSYSMEKRYFTASKQLVWVNLTVSLVLKSDGTPDYFISVIEDITARKQLEAERDGLIEELEIRVTERTAELEKLTMTDPLTGIANRRHLDEYLATEWDRAVRARQPISLVLIDLDHFKGLNDGLGHGAADRALKAVSAALTQLMQRSGDLAARYGGDEFILVLPNTNPEGALKVATDVQDAVKKLGLPHPGSPIDTKVTVSAGVATWWPLKKGAANSLLLAADRALYGAKRAGRNRVVVAGSAKVNPGTP